MEMEKIIEKIAQHRNRKGFTYENMANELDITPAAYRKIEIGETKLTVERLFKISDILDLPITDFLDLEKDILHQNNHDNENVFQQKVNFYNDNKDVYQELLKSKDDQIALLKEMLTKKNN